MDLNRRFSDNEPCWLIKVDTKISGPWSFNEVLLKLTRGELKPFHEAHSPMDRWRSLQSQPLFSAAVERLKKQNQVNEDNDHTITRTEKSMFTRTIDLSGDRPIPASMNETITPPPVFKDGQIANPIPRPVQRPTPVIAVKKSPMVPIIIGLGVLVFVLLVYILLPGRRSEVAPTAKNQFLESVDSGLAFKKTGDWYEALKNFKKAYALNNKDVDLVFEMAPLLVQVENQTMTAKGMMEKIMYGQYKKENLSLGKNILGLVSSYEEQYKVAVKQFDDVLKEDETYYPSLVNKGYALMQMGDYTNAEHAFAEALKADNGSVLPYVYLIENYIFDGVKNNKKLSYEKAFNLASQVSNKFLDGQQEILLFQAYAAFKLGKDTNLIQTLIQKSLTVDPDLTSEHLHSPLVDWRGLNWARFNFMCNEFSRVLKPELQSLMEFVCTYKTNNDISSQQAVSGWISRSQNSPWPQIAQSLISLRLGDVDKAKVSLDMAKTLGANDKFYYQTLVRACGKLKDVGCLRKNIDAISKLSPLHAFTAKAIEGKLTGGDNKQAVYSGLRESSNYIPLIKLQ